MSHNVEIEQALNAGLHQLAMDGVIDVSAHIRDMLVRYVYLLAKWNRVYNLTAVKEPLDMVNRHIHDSLVVSRWLPQHPTVVPGSVDLIDIGSGAGLPVLPLAIVRPDMAFVSIESNGKKTRFQQQAVVELGLKNVEVLNQRVQDTQASAVVVTSRAFTAPSEFLKIAGPLGTTDGKIIIMLTHTDKLPDPLPAGFELQELVALDIPGAQVPRHIAVCRRCQ